jgi:hypothetical protein
MRSRNYPSPTDRESRAATKVLVTTLAIRAFNRIKSIAKALVPCARCLVGAVKTEQMFEAGAGDADFSVREDQANNPQTMAVD